MNDNILVNLINKITNNGFLDEEIEQGAIEYKLRLDKMNNSSLKKIESQMLWRINEGKLIYNIYKAYYVLGILDNGQLGNMTPDIVENSILVIKKICENINIKVDYVFKYKYQEFMIAIILIKKTINKHIPELNIFLLGNSGTNKTTLLGNLCYDSLDDNKGKSRLLILKHKHELSSGKSSSIHHEIIGINNNNNNNNDNNNELINYRNSSLDFNNSWDKIFNKSDIIINFFDSPGDAKYIKTSYSNIFNINPDYIFIFTNVDDIEENNNEFINKLKLGLAMKKKIFLIITQSFKYQNINLERIIIKIQNNILLYGLIYNLCSINNQEYEESEEYNVNTNNLYYVYVDTSEKTSFDKFKNIFINKIINTNKIIKSFKNKEEKDEVCFNIYETFDIPILNKNIIVSGKLISGKIEINKEYYINNSIIKVINIHNKNIDTDILLTGETGCLEIYFIDEKININKFMTIYENPLYFKSIENFKIIIDKDVNKNINIPDEVYIYSKYFCNIFESNKKEYDNFYELNIKSKINFHIYNLIENDLCFIKTNDNYLIGRIIY